MKRRRFSFLTTIFMMLVLVSLIAIGGICLKETLDLPDWVIPLIAMVLTATSFEFASRFGPKEFDIPFSIFRQENRRDQIVVPVAFVVFIVIALPVGRGIFAKSDLAAAGCFIFGVCAFYRYLLFRGNQQFASTS